MCTQATHKYMLTHTDLCIFTSTDSHIHRHIQVSKDYSCTHQETHTPVLTGGPDNLEYAPRAPHRATPPGSLSHSLTTQGSLPSEHQFAVSASRLSSSNPSWSPAWNEAKSRNTVCLSDHRTGEDGRSRETRGWRASPGAFWLHTA